MCDMTKRGIILPPTIQSAGSYVTISAGHRVSIAPLFYTIRPEKELFSRLMQQLPRAANST